MHVLDLWFHSPLWEPGWCIFLKVTPSRYVTWFTSFGIDCSTGFVSGLVVSEGIGFLGDLSGSVFRRSSTWMYAAFSLFSVVTLFLILAEFLSSYLSSFSMQSAAQSVNVALKGMGS